MRKIKNKNLAELLLQLRFTPVKKRQKQLDATEKLFAIIDKDKEYPFEFVCFHITGFHPKSVAEAELIKGDELLDDLRIFISKLSGQLACPAGEQDQKVYTIEELATAFNASTKTIYRWRKRGLIVRKFIFDDGVRRFGFFQSTVDKFLKANPDLIAKAKRFERLTDKQKQQIVKQAAKLADDTNLSRYQIIDRIAAKFGKCHETIRYTLQNYEKANPDKPIFKKPAGVVDAGRSAEIYHLFKQGCAVKDLMKSYCRTKSSIYRIINKRRAKELLAKKIEFIASDEFLEKDAGEKILKKPTSGAEPTVFKSVELFELAGSSLPEYLQTLKDVPVLNREREVELFRRYNYLKYSAYQIRAGMKSSHVSSATLSQIEDYLDEAEEVKRRLIEANLRLVVSVAHKHTTSGANLLDLVSEGNISLMQAVEKFDYTRGFRFATYASWVIAKDYARKMPAQTARLDRATAASLAEIHRDLRSKDTADFAAIERARQNLTQIIKDNLTEREQYVILNRFGLVGSPIKKQTKTLKQVGEELGLSKERVRQIELIALQKLRLSLSSEEFELLTG